MDEPKGEIVERSREHGGRKTSSNKLLLNIVEQTARLIGLGQMKSAIKAAIRALFVANGLGEPSARTCGAYLRRARDLIIEQSGKTKEQHVAEAEAFYRAMIQTAVADGDKLAALNARKRLDELFGIDEPKKSKVEVGKVGDEELDGLIVGFAKALAGGQAPPVSASGATGADRRPDSGFPVRESDAGSVAGEFGPQPGPTDPPPLFP